MEPLLGSWKEIAVHLNRGVRTLQRWEKENGLPVHRLGDGSKAPVFAFPAEIQDWLYTKAPRVPPAPVPDRRISAVRWDRKALEHQRELRIRMLDLLRIQHQKIFALRHALEGTNRSGQIVG